MTKKKRLISKRNLYIFVGVIIVFSIILFLLFGNFRQGGNFVGIQAYKYKIGKDDSKYYVEKITSSKIAIEKTYDVRCYSKSCFFVKGFFATGNVSDTMAVLYDDNNYYLIDFYNKNREEINVSGIKYVNFTKDGKYVLLFTSNNSFYAYNISNKTLSLEVHFDYIVYENSFDMIDNTMFVYSDNKYKLVNIDTGKFENIICDNVRKLSNYYVLNIEGKDRLYQYNKGFKELDISYDKIIDIKENYALVSDNKALYLIDLNNKENVRRLMDDYNYEYLSMNVDLDFVNVFLSNEKCYLITYSIVNDDVNISNVECPSDNIMRDIYVLSKKDESVVITYGKDFKESYDLIATKNGFLYDMYGKYYDKVSISSSKNHINFKSGFDIPKGNEYKFLKEKFEILGLNNKIQNDYFNLLMPVMLSNKENFIYFDINNESISNEYKVLNKVDSYVNIDIYISGNYQKLPIENLEKEDISGFSVVSLSIR